MLDDQVVEDASRAYYRMMKAKMEYDALLARIKGSGSLVQYRAFVLECARIKAGLESQTGEWT